MPLVLNGIVQSGSRSAFIGILCAGAVLTFLKPGGYRLRYYGLALVGVVLFGMVAQSMYWERMSTIKAATSEDETQMDASAASRFAIVSAQLRMAAAYPFGAGHRGTAVLSPDYIEERYRTSNPNNSQDVKRRSSHNTAMTALVEQGVPGGILYLMFCSWVISEVRRLSRTFSQTGATREGAQIAAIGGALTVVLIAGQFVDYLKSEVQFWMFALLGSLAAQVAGSISGQSQISGTNMALSHTSVPRVKEK
jgi:O-antigen ligase